MGMKVWAVVLMGCWGWAGGQGLPATAPTVAQPSPAVMPGRVMAAPTAPVLPVKRAKVQFAGRTLEVTADNSSINQILREVSRVTGMKISGGVTEERVYGQYGPGDVGSVLAKLLSGTGSNMLLMLDAREMPAELILTQRTGGASPPSPAASARDDEREGPDVPPQLSRKTPAEPVAAVPVAPAPVPVPQAAAVDAPAAVPAAGGSPNGVKTPQQIYEQLMQLQGQQQKAPK